MAAAQLGLGVNDDFESMWRAVSTGLNCLTPTEREKWRKLLIRRLRHPEAGAHPESTPEYLIHKRQGGGPMLKLDSPLCECNDPRTSHDDEGACMACHCPMYTNEDGH